MMKKRFVSICLSTSILLGLSACSQPYTYNQQSVGQIETVQVGRITQARWVNIDDDGTGVLLGALLGAGLGHAAGVKGKTQTETTVGGAALGALAGSQVNKDSGQELSILLGNGQEITTVHRIDRNTPISYREGDRVKVYMRGGRITRINLIQ